MRLVGPVLLLVVLIYVAMRFLEEEEPATVPDPPPAGTTKDPADVPDALAGEGEGAGSGEPIGEPDVVAAKPAGLPLIVAVVDVVSGDILAGTEVFRVEGKTRRPFEREGSLHILDPAAGFFPSHEVRLELDVRVPQGFALARAEFGLTAVISRYAKRLLVTVPAWPAAPVVVSVTEEDGSPVAGAAVVEVTVGYQERSVQASRTNAAGETWLGGIPLIHGEPIAVVVSDRGRLGAGSARILKSEGEIRVKVVLPPEDEILDHHEIDTDSDVEDHFESAIGLGGAPEPPTPAGPVVPLRLRVTRHDGSPAAQTKVVLNRDGRPTRMVSTDAAGVATFDEVEVGDVRIAVTEPGFLMDDPILVMVTESLPEEGLEIREDLGRTVDALVTMPDGEPAAFARIRIRGGAYAPTDAEGEQSLTLYTDRSGRITIPNLSKKAEVILAGIGSRSGHGAIPADGRVRIKLTGW